MKKLRIYFPQDHSTFISNPLSKDFIETKLHYILIDGGFWFVEGESGEMLLTRGLLERVTITLI